MGLAEIVCTESKGSQAPIGPDQAAAPRSQSLFAVPSPLRCPKKGEAFICQRGFYCLYSQLSTNQHCEEATMTVPHRLSFCTVLAMLFLPAPALVFGQSKPATAAKPGDVMIEHFLQQETAE